MRAFLVSTTAEVETGRGPETVARRLFGRGARVIPSRLGWEVRASDGRYIADLWEQ